MACSDAERAGEHSHVSKATEQQVPLEEIVLRMTSGYQKHQDSGPHRETALSLRTQGGVKLMGWGKLKSPPVTGEPFNSTVGRTTTKDILH